MELGDWADWPLMRERGLAVVAARAHASLTEGLNRREQHDRLEREIRANLALAVEWGIPVLICFSGNRAGADDGAGLAATAGGLRRVARAAGEAGGAPAPGVLNSKGDPPRHPRDPTPRGARGPAAGAAPRARPPH